ncbi:hypothetical protein [Spirosoma aerolatum]|uniref:hypothetical protein n=1 Tax=Spirosoma aerolatum TaxID=1211326 RepID=UPI0009AEFECA|nr:hypothetical protein [Spirosoma aerolatum]
MYSADTNRLLTQLQTIYHDLIQIGPVERANAYQLRITAIEQARLRIWDDVEACQCILDEFSPEFILIQRSLSKIVEGRS